MDLFNPPAAKNDELCKLREEARLALLELQDESARQGVQEVLELIQMLMTGTSTAAH